MSDNTLKQLIREKYPFPISHAYTYLESRVDPKDRHQALLACFEVTLKTIASIGLANLMRDIQNDPTLGNANLFQDLLDALNGPLSLGHWQDLLRLTLRPYAAHRERLMVPQLFDFYYRVTEQGNIRTQKQHLQVIMNFIQERNEEAHHRNRSQVSKLQRQSKVEELTRDLDTLLRGLGFLTEYTFLYVEHAEHLEGQWHYHANFISGTSYPFQQRTWKTNLGINSRRCLIVDEAKSAVLELNPFVIVTSEGRLQQPDIFFFDGVFSSGRANYMCYHIDDYIEPADESSPVSLASDAISSLLKLLENQIPLAPNDAENVAEDRLSVVEIYHNAVSWALEHGERQSISLDALRQILNLSREEALKQERELGLERGIEVEPEVEVPFDGVPSWANLAYYILDNSGHEEMFYKDIAAEAEQLKDQVDPDWQKGTSANVEATVSRIMSQDPRFYKLRRGYFRLTKHNDLLSNPSWANLAHFVLQRYDPQRRGMQLQAITEKAVALKQKHSDWQGDAAQTPSHTVSATMSQDRRFESMSKRGYWRLVEAEVRPQPQLAVSETPSSTRDQAYDTVLKRLAEIGEVKPLPFGRTYFSLNDNLHLMFRFSKAHYRNGEIEFFLGVTPQYFERIDALGNGFLALVLGAPDNVLFVSTEIFARWVEGLEPSGSGTWPLAFYQSQDKTRLERWVSGQGREDVTALLNDYASLQQALSKTSATNGPRSKAPTRIADLLQAGLLKPGDEVYAKRRPDRRATVVDATFLTCDGKQWRYNDWGTYITGWASINIYREVILTRTGQSLDDLRKQLQGKRTGRQGS